MKKLSIFFSLFTAAAFSVSAQKPFHNAVTYPEWADKPVVHPVPPEYANEPAIVLLNDIALDYRYEGKSTNMFITEHRIIKVLDDRGIENFNTYDLPVFPGTRVPSIKARTILPNGTVREIAQDMILVTKNAYGYWSVIIAMEGVEKNAEIEFLTKEIVSAPLFGSQIFQFPIPVMKTHFSMSYPKEWVFQEKGYNGFPDVKDTLIKNRRHMDITLNDIPKLRSEPNSFYELRLMRMEYRIDHFNFENENNRSKRYTWNDLGRKMYDTYYKITDKERAAVNAYLTELGVKPNGNELENLKKIERGIKTGIVKYGFIDYDDRKQVLATQAMRSISLYDVAYDEQKNVLDSIITKRAATPDGIIKLFAACFVQAGINNELGIVGNRHESMLDPEFENWDNLEYHLFYFPDFKKYLSPTSDYYRYPMVPEEALNNKGVFCTIPPNGIPTGGIVEIRTIKPLSANENQSNIAAAVSFSTDMDATVDVSYSFTGYQSTHLRTELVLSPKDKQVDIVKKIVTIAEKPENILKYTISNEGFDNYTSNKPLEITATVSTNQMVDEAGKNYLLKVGKIIGKQQELYNEDERMLPVDMDYPHSFNRTITINLPVGYKVINPEVLRMHADYVNREITPVISFNSDYTLVPDKKKGDKLVITVTEFYNQIHFSPNDYERYRKVVNTAADFSKVAILLTNTKKSAGKQEHALTKK